MPGTTIGQVTENVYETVRGEHLLIPQGARIVGKYDRVVAFGQKRALVVWSQLILPNGNSVVIENPPQSARQAKGTNLNERNWVFQSGNPRTMPRYFFKITNGKPHNDHTGEELRDENAAWQESKRLTRDIEDSLEMNGHWNVEVSDAEGPLYSIKIASQKLR